jgi:hypothetical protein
VGQATLEIQYLGGHVGATNAGLRQAGPVPRIIASPIAASRAAASRLRAHAPGPALQGLLALSIYLGIFIGWFALPLISHLDVPNVRQNWTDPNFYTWALRWWPYAVSHWINPLYSAQIGAPGGYDLAWATTAPSVALLFWPVTAAFGPVVSFHLALLLVPAVSGWAAFIVARRLTGRFWAALLAGAVYGFCPFELTHSLQGQPNLTAIALLPLMLYLVLLWWDGTLGRTGFVIWMTVAMVLEFYTFVEAFAEMTVVWTAALVIGVAVAGRAARRKVARLAGLTAIAYAGALVLAAPYLIYALAHYPGTLTRQLPIFSLRLVRLILPWYGLYWPGSLYDYSIRLGRYSIENYVGIPLLVILIALAVFAWRSRITRLVVIVFVVIIALAVGPNLIVGGTQVFPLPWGRLWSLPIARSAEPSRFMVFGFLVLAIALALWLAAPAASRPLRAARWGLGLLAIAAIFADLPTFYSEVVPKPPLGHAVAMRPVNELPAFITDGLYRHYLKPGEIVVVVSDRGNAGLLFQASAGFYFRIAGGFINTSLTPQNALPRPVALLTHSTRAREKGFGDYVHAAGVGAIIVEQAWAEPWMSVFGRLGLHGTPVGGVTVYPTGSGQGGRLATYPPASASGRGVAAR